MADEKQTKEPAKEPAKPKVEEAAAPAVPNLGGIEPITASPVTPKKGKKRVKKNVAAGIVHIASTFNNTMITITDVDGERDRVVERRRARLQGLAQVHAVRRAGRRGRRRREGDGARPQDRSASW